MDAAVAAVNTALYADSADSTLQSLQNEHLDLSDLDPANSQSYHESLAERKRGKTNGRLTVEEIQDCIKQCDARAEMDRLGEYYYMKPTIFCIYTTLLDTHVQRPSCVTQQITLEALTTSLCPWHYVCMHTSI